RLFLRSFFFFFTAPAPTALYTLSLHDALPICSSPSAEPRSATATSSSTCARSRSCARRAWPCASTPRTRCSCRRRATERPPESRSEEHTSELQSQSNLVCRLLLEKKKKKKQQNDSDQPVSQLIVAKPPTSSYNVIFMII